MQDWPRRRWVVAEASAAVTVLFVAIPAALIPSPVFGRSVPATPWAGPALLVTAGLSGLLTATYVARPSERTMVAPAPSRTGLAGGFLAYLAIGGCALVAPFQPLLAAVGIGLLSYALRRRLSGERSCPMPSAT